MKNKVKNIFIMFGVVFLLLAIYTTINKDAEEKQIASPVPVATAPATIAPTIKNEVHVVFKDEYMGGCVGEEATYEYCSCTYDYLLDMLGLKGIMQMAIDVDETGELTDDMVEAISGCIHLY